jgi:hypothetical protein
MCLYGGDYGFCGKPVPGKPGWFYAIDGEFYGYNKDKSHIRQPGISSNGSCGWLIGWHSDGKTIRTGVMSIHDLLIHLLARSMMPGVDF